MFELDRFIYQNLLISIFERLKTLCQCSSQCFKRTEFDIELNIIREKRFCYDFACQLFIIINDNNSNMRKDIFISRISVA